jgi:ATP-dependent Clp protease adaptor protein ClpS
MTPLKLGESSVPVMEPDVEIRTRRQPPYLVLIENDEDHSMEFVIAMLQKVFGFSVEKAFELMMVAHSQGEAVVWSGAREVAELKCEQVLSMHEKHWKSGRDLGPVGCRIEPAE